MKLFDHKIYIHIHKEVGGAQTSPQSCKLCFIMTSVIAENTNLMFSVSVAQVK